MSANEPLLRVVSGRPVPAAGIYEIDTGFTSIRFVVRRLFTPTNGHFTRFSGRVRIADVPDQSQVSITVSTRSLWLPHQGTLEAAVSSELLGVEDFPEATFVSTSLLASEDERWRLTGNLSIRGITNSVPFDVRFIGAAIHPLSGARTITMQARGAFDRRDFGINAHQHDVASTAGVLVVGNQIAIAIDLEASIQTRH